MFNPLKVIFGTKNNRDLKILKPLVNQIGAIEPTMQKMSDEELKAQTPKLKKMLEDGNSLTDILPEAFATVREASVRVLGLRPYDVQLVGAIVLYQSRIAEMKTGEGKTLTAALTLYLHALSGKGAHLVTVNDYLARRDAEEMTGPLYDFLGITYGVIIADMSDEDRKAAYQADITYGTNNEFAFDYLRDNMKFDLEDYVQRGHNFCIVDEVDSILIDEARTPLLISGPSETNTELYSVANDVIPNLKRDEHFTVDEKSRTITFTEEGIIHVQKVLDVENLYDLQHNDLLHHLNQSLKAHNLFKKDVDYVVKDNKVVIVDEFTGRLKEGSNWSDGLHQAVEAKENVTIKSENQTLASITFQNYFRLYGSLSGMTGTAATEAEEFMKIYKLDVVIIPTNVLIARIDEADVIYKNKAAKARAVIKLVRELNAKGQPVLIGTNSIDSSEFFHAALTKEGIKHEMLNAKNHEREATIIADAGKKGSITIATNMAGRGTDIKINDEIKSLGGLYIVGTERNEARRIDNQLRGRSGRQGDPGHSKFFLSLEDDLMRIFGSERISKVMNTLGMEEDEPIEHKMITNAIAKSQKKVEAHNFEIRKHLLQYDDVMGEQRSVIYRLRKDILSDQGNDELVSTFIEDVSELLVDAYRPQKKVPLESWTWDEMTAGFNNTFHSEIALTAKECIEKHDGEPETYTANLAKDLLKKHFEQYDPEQVKLALREILLSSFDQHWKDHLHSMDSIKEGINLRSYAQKDPLNEYKREAFQAFEAMRVAVKKAILTSLFGVKLYSPEEIEELQRQHQEDLERQLEAHKRAQEMQEGAAKPITRGANKVGRNDPCPCGSGKKFKQCHGAS
jgi:preprotein translocase subunit SecA